MDLQQTGTNYTAENSVLEKQGQEGPWDSLNNQCSQTTEPGQFIQKPCLKRKQKK